MSCIKSFFDSPKNQDRSSKIKLIHLILVYILYIAFFIIILGLVWNRNSNNRLTITKNKIENEIEIDLIVFSTNLTMFSLNTLDINYQFNYPDFDFYCYKYSLYANEYDCFNKTDPYPTPQNLLGYEIGEFIFPAVEKIKLSYNKSYYNFNYYTDDNYSPNLWMNNIKLFYGDFNVSLPVMPPQNVQVLIKKEVYVDKLGNKKEIIKSKAVSSQFISESACPFFGSPGYYIPNCKYVELSFYYESNIVSYYYEETDKELALRIITDIFSIVKLGIYFIGVVLLSLLPNLIYDDKALWVSNSIRDAVLYHYKYYLVDPNYQKYGIISKIKRIFCKSRRQSKSTSVSIDTNIYGSKSKLKRLFESIGDQDKLSSSISYLSLFTNVLLWITMVLIIILVCVFTIPNRDLITQYESQTILEIPKINFSINVNGFADYYPVRIFETYPNNSKSMCILEYDANGRNYCNYSNYNSGVNTYYYNNVIIIEPDSFSLKTNTSYSFQILSGVYFEPYNEYHDMSTILVTIDGIQYKFQGSSIVTFSLEKSIYIFKNGTKKIFYSPRFSTVHLDLINTGTTTLGKEKFYLINSFAVAYNDVVARTIHEETDLQIGIKTITSILAFYSPVSLFCALLFYILQRLIFSSPSAHCDPSVREAIIYHIKYHSQLNDIYK